MALLPPPDMFSNDALPTRPDLASAAKGQPKTGGRQKGTKNTATAKREAEIAASGLTPLDYMLSVVRDTEADEKRRDAMASAAAPYVHPKLAAVEHSGDVTVRHEDAIEDLE